MIFPRIRFCPYTGKDRSEKARVSDYYTQFNLMSNIPPIVPKTKFHISSTLTKVVFRICLSMGSSKDEALF